MIITIKGANFKDSNIGTLSSYTVRFSGDGVSGSPTSIAKNEEGTQASANYVGTITVSSSYTYKSVSSVTVNGTALSTSDYTVSGMNITIPANKITGNVVITVATEKVNTQPDTPTMYTFTINPTPSTATVTLTASGYAQSGNSITVPSGTSVAWKVEASGYVTQNGTHTVTKTETKNVTLVQNSNNVTLIDTIEGIVLGFGSSADNNHIGDTLSYGITGVGAGNTKKYFVPAFTKVTITFDPTGNYGMALTDETDLVYEGFSSRDIESGTYTFQSYDVDTYLYISENKFISMTSVIDENVGYRILEYNAMGYVLQTSAVGSKVVISGDSKHHKYLIPAGMKVTLSIINGGNYGMAMTDMNDIVLEFTKSNSQGTEPENYTFAAQPTDCYLYVSVTKLNSIRGEY